MRKISSKGTRHVPARSRNLNAAMPCWTSAHVHAPNTEPTARNYPRLPYFLGLSSRPGWGSVCSKSHGSMALF